MMAASSRSGWAGPLFSQSKTMTPPPAARSTFSVFRSRWQVLAKAGSGGATAASSAISSGSRQPSAAAQVASPRRASLSMACQADSPTGSLNHASADPGSACGS